MFYSAKNTVRRGTHPRTECVHKEVENVHGPIDTIRKVGNSSIVSRGIEGCPSALRRISVFVAVFIQESRSFIFSRSLYGVWCDYYSLWNLGSGNVVLLFCEFRVSSKLAHRTFVQLYIRVLLLVSRSICYSWRGARLGDAIFLFCDIEVSSKCAHRQLI
jgi:hypothetical protein